MEKMKEIMFPILVRYNGSHPDNVEAQMDEVIDSMKQKHEKKDPELETVFNGPDYP